MHTEFQSEIVKERDHLGDIVVERMVILKWFLRGGARAGWINLVQDRVE
jgi:hypothetical protein